MTGATAAVPTEVLERASFGSNPQPLCPSQTPDGPCMGRLHPFHVEITLGGFHGQDYADGWVLVCVGQKAGDLLERDAPPCGFSMPVTPRRHARGGLVAAGRPYIVGESGPTPWPADGTDREGGQR